MRGPSEAQGWHWARELARAAGGGLPGGGCQSLTGVPHRLQGAQPRHRAGGVNRKGVLKGAGVCDIELGQEGWRQFVFIISFNN